MSNIIFNNKITLDLTSQNDIRIVLKTAMYIYVYNTETTMMGFRFFNFCNY